MLLEFKFKNYKSFKDEAKFSMIPSYNGKNFDYSVFKKKIGNKAIKCLCSSVIYGANASGKTNIISAMETFKRILLSGKIVNSKNFYSLNIAANNLELIPNYKLSECIPVCFYMDFISYNYRIQYTISLDLGMFSQDVYDRKVIEEKLVINGVNIFERNHNKVNIGDLLKISKINNDINNDKNIPDLEKEDNGLLNSKSIDERLLEFVTRVDDLDLFLCNNFRTNISKNIYNIINSWIEKKFVVIFKANNVISDIPSNNDTGEIHPDVNKAAQIFGTISDKFAYIKDSGKESKDLYSIITLPNGEKNAIRSAIFESYGTNRFMNLFPILNLILKNGGTLIIDEFDASIHPMAIINLINIL